MKQFIKWIKTPGNMSHVGIAFAILATFHTFFGLWVSLFSSLLICFLWEFLQNVRRKIKWSAENWKDIFCDVVGVIWYIVLTLLK